MFADRRAAPAWLTLDAVVDHPRPGASAPSQFAFSPDGRLLTFLWSERGDLARDLWGLDVRTGERALLARAAELSGPEAELTPEETLRRERQRVREGGITQYHWARRAARILVPLNGQLYLIEPGGRPPRLLAPSSQPAVDARLTADGARVVFARGKELWVAEVETGEVRQLTFDSAEAVSNGVAEFIAQEEMGRSSGFWISPDDALVAYAQVDESNVPQYPIVHQTRDWRVEHHRYPFAGAANARVRLGVVPLAGGPTRWLPLEEGDEYLARVDWQDPAHLLAQTESRDQRRLELRRYVVALPSSTAADGAGRGAPSSRAASSGAGIAWQTLLVEESEVWINLHHDLRVLADGAFIWASERTGFKHLALHDRDGRPVRSLTDGPWPVDSVLHVDEPAGCVYFTAARPSPIQRHIFRVPLAGGEAVALTQEPGFHTATFAADGSRFVHTWESRTQPPRSVLRSLTDGTETVVHAGGRWEDVAPGLQPPQIVELAASDGTRLYGALYWPYGRTGGDGEGAGQEPPGSREPGQAPPAGREPGQTPPGSREPGQARPGSREPGQAPPAPVDQPRAPAPLVVSVYGGPHVQMVSDTWGLTIDLRAQHLAARGFLVFKLDNRGSARRGLAFERALRWRLGTVEVEDQAAGVRWLVDQGLADPARVGIYGWSYGGYLAARCLLLAPEVFRAAVAGAPVTDWDGYDTHYTERYMGHPDQNPEGYRAASLLTHAERLQGQLLLVHGLLDENVHFRHTARFIAELERAGRPFQLLVLPEERHGLRPTAANRPIRRHFEERLATFFAEQLRADE